MKNIRYATLLFVLVAGFMLNSGCQMNFMNCIEVKGTKVTTETRNPRQFTGIKLAIPAEVYVKLGDESKVEITAKRRVMDQILTTVDEDELVLEYDTCVSNPDSITIFITTASLSSVKIVGSGGVSSKHILEVDEIELMVAGSGDIKLKLTGGTVNAKINGSGDINLEGNAKTLVAGINGSGDIRAGKLEATNAKVKINGSGDVEIHAVDELEVKINGSGDVRYQGDPEVTKTINGSGSIKRK